jgi:hypothetical protein
MYNHQFTEETIDDIILQFSDESFSFRDAIWFEVLLKQKPEYFEIAQTNRQIKNSLRSLPKLKAAPGFEARLAMRIDNEC